MNMNTLDDYIKLISGPLTVLCVTRCYQMLDTFKASALRFSDNPLDPCFTIPILCISSTTVMSLLTQQANRKYIALRLNDPIPATSPLAYFSYASIICLLFMLFFGIDRDCFPYWMLSYGALCFINAVWNYLALSPSNTWGRVVHVTVNLVLGIALVSIYFFKVIDPLTHPNRIYFLFFIIFSVKWWQRSLCPRFETS